MTAYWPNGTTKPGIITDRYGPRKPIRGSRPFHYGTDIDTDEGDLIHAAMAGVVIFSGTNGSLGEQIVIQCDRYQFLYPHNKDGTLPRVGQKVAAGQPMCETGLTGNTTGYHSCFRIFDGSWERDEDARNPEVVMAELNAGSSTASGNETALPTPVNPARRRGVEMDIKYYRRYDGKIGRFGAGVRLFGSREDYVLHRESVQAYAKLYPNLNVVVPPNENNEKNFVTLDKAHWEIEVALAGGEF